MKRSISSLFMAGCAAVAIAAEHPADYAFGMLLETPGNEALYEITLPPAVYRAIAHRDLRDVRVFNNAGEVVPHAWKTATRADTLPPVSTEVTLYPLKAPAGVAVDAVSVSVRRSAAGATTINVNAPAAPAHGLSRIVGYLLDVTQVERALRAIEFDWLNPADGFVGKLRIDGSDDLANWRTLVAGAPLVSLEVRGQRLQQKRVELPQQKVKYLRISWVAQSPAAPEPELISAKCELADQNVDVVREWEQATGTTGALPGEYIFDLRAHFPVDRIRLGLPQPNTIVHVSLLTRDRADADWQPIARDVVYRLQQGGSEIVSADIPVSVSADRYWLVRVEQRGGGIGPGELELHAGWIPHGLVFAARGTAPFQLAFGNREAKPGAYSIETLVPEYRTSQRRLETVKTAESKVLPLVRARALETRELGGERRRQDAIDWKRWSLWASLLIGVLVLALMAWRLARQVGTRDAGTNVEQPKP